MQFLFCYILFFGYVLLLFSSTLFLVIRSCHSDMCSFHHSFFLCTVIVCCFYALFMCLFMCSLYSLCLWALCMCSLYTLFECALFMYSLYNLFECAFLCRLSRCIRIEDIKYLSNRRLGYHIVNKDREQRATNE